ncbi:MAG: excinuclease ABC subunit B, partial [Verrucomicrobiota bacterium]
MNNKIHKVDLCEACASKMGVAEPGSASLQNLLKKNLFQNTGVELNEAEEAEACPSCGFTLRSFRKAGRFGCP